MFETPSFGFQFSKHFSGRTFGDLKRDIDTRLGSLSPSVVDPGDSGEVASLRDEKVLFERRLAAAKEAEAARRG